MVSNLPHLFLNKEPEKRKFTSMGSINNKIKNYKPNVAHGKKIFRCFSSIIETERPEYLPEDYKVYITVEGSKDLLNVLSSLENERQNINVKISTIKTDGKNYRITLCVNKKYLTSFYKKLNGYISELTKKGVPKNRELMNEIENVSKSVINDLWIGENDLMPPANIKKWCEVWILDTKKDSFIGICNELGIRHNPKSIMKFVERIVMQIEISATDMKNLLLNYDLIGEFRPINALSSFWTSLHRAEQSNWVDNLLSRLEVENKSNTIINVMDTGVNNRHPLLKKIISDSDCDSCNPIWKEIDTDGHGTEMCGIAVYGDLQQCLEQNTKIQIKHGVISTKLLPTGNYKNEEVSYGAITSEAISRSRILHPRKNIINCLAVTEDETNNIEGLPSSWSATIDAIAAGKNIFAFDEVPIEINEKMLFIISAGNIDDMQMKYPDDNKTMPIQSPAQAWNALTIGAYTKKSDIIDGKNTLAKNGGLSPYSRTSFAWKNSTCPIKPEVLFEGGNKIVDASHSFQSNNHSVLTTDKQFIDNYFSLSSGTSPATAEAAHFAAQLQVEYPQLWAETLRGLIIHSAEWTEEMKRQFLPSSSRKRDYENILRTCGYGVPNIERALHSAKNSLVLIAQNEIQPYIFEEKSVKTNEMHLYELPWAKDALLELGETEIELKVTLSYFIEPAPFSMGKIPNNKYKYSSCGLRFDLNRPNETKDFFIKKINKIDNDLAKRNGETLGSREKPKWLYGEDTGINNGSIHSNVWKGTAAELATCNILAVYPVMGWWKERKSAGAYNNKLRYSLIVSIKTPSVETDIYTPIANIINIPVSTQINI